MFQRALLVSWCACAGAGALAAETPPPTELGEIVITATLRPTAAASLPASVTVLDAATARAAGVQHFGDLLGQVPNLIAAGGTSRPRYFQLRGIGEQEQYQGAPNPSVGFLIDGMDFSGVGMPALLFDLERVEVLRGPQSAIHGANALAGLISVTSHEATDEVFNARAELTIGEFRDRAAAVALGGDGWRVAAQRSSGGGFRRNAFLGRDDTNGFDERLVRGKWHHEFGSAVTADATLLHADLDNGYDAWSIDGSRDTQTDAPGRDAQRANGAALRVHWLVNDRLSLQSLSSVADSRSVFSFDGDWGNNAFWARQPACRPDPAACVPYDFTSRTDRWRRTVSQDLRLLLPHTLVGVYALRLTEDNEQLDRYNGAVYRQLGSAYAATNVALYGGWTQALAARWTLDGEARAEQRRADYRDSDRSAFAPTDRMLGGKLSLGYAAHSGANYYLALARGYKAGGFNIGSSVPANRRQFRPEYLWSLEAGGKGRSAGGALRWQAALFYMRRLDQQVSTSEQSDPGDPLSYAFYTDNAARGENLGLESSLQWQAHAHWRFDASLALLRARYLDFNYRVVDYDAQGNARIVLRDLAGRQQEYAPAQQLALSASYAPGSGWFARLDVARQSAYYFSASHDQQARAATLVNARAGYRRGAWEFSLWARNLFSAAHDAHGFYFGNEPPAFPNRLYRSPGEPRRLGLTLRYSLQP